MCDEIEYNAFYFILQNEYKKKYELALHNCWTICIPCNAALRGIKINDAFVDLHLLKSCKDSSCSSSCDELFESGLHNSYAFRVRNETIVLNKAPFPLNEEYVVSIIFIESGYNKEFQLYKILVIDKPLSPTYCPLSPDNYSLNLDQKITSLQEATSFLTRFSLIQLDESLKSLLEDSLLWSAKLEDVHDKIREVLSAHWVRLLKTQTSELQRDARFQKSLTAALENYITHALYDFLFPVICRQHRQQDNSVQKKLQELAEKQVTADQLGAAEDLSVPLPAAVVELASLDILTAPVDKLFCLRTTLDLILAEIKGAMIDAQSVVSYDAELPAISTDDLLPLLMSVIIQAKPLHMYSNLYYIENFQWTLSPKDAMSFSMVTFEAAVDKLLGIEGGDLKPRCEKVHRELGFEELIKVTGEVREHFDRHGERCHLGPVSPLDRQLERITALIEASTQDLNSSVVQKDV